MTAGSTPYRTLGLARDLEDRLMFLRDIDQMKSIVRQTLLADGSRQETDAEHSWELGMMVMTLADYAPAGVDRFRVMQMVLLHDLVEIDAGDTYAYDPAANADKDAREQRAADRIFGLLPTEQGRAFRQLWEEFEARETPDARFARGIDRLQPLLHSYLTHGQMWHRNGIRPAQVRAGARLVQEGMPELAAFIDAMLTDCEARGFFPDLGPETGA